MPLRLLTWTGVGVDVDVDVEQYWTGGRSGEPFVDELVRSVCLDQTLTFEHFPHLFERTLDLARGEPNLA